MIQKCILFLLLQQLHGFQYSIMRLKQDEQYLAMKDVNQTHFIQKFHAGDDILDSYEFKYQDDDNHDKVFISVLEYTPKLNIQLQYCILQTHLNQFQSFLKAQIKDQSLIQFIIQKGFTFQFKLALHHYKCTGINIIYNTLVYQQMVPTLTEIIHKKSIDLNRHPLVNQFNRFQKQQHQQFYLKQTLDTNGLSVNDQITYFYDHQQSQTLFLMQIDEILHDMKIIQQLHSKQQIEFDFEIKGASGLTRNQKIRPNNQFETNVSKSIEGLGLHRTLKYALDIDTKHIDDENRECQVLLLDYLDYDQYLDIEEFNHNTQFTLAVEQVIDIEKPSVASTQHYYTMQFNISKSTQFHFLLPIHFRYRNPSDSLYKLSYITTKPKIFMNCQKGEDVDEFISYLNLKWHLSDVTQKYRVKVNDVRDSSKFADDQQIEQSLNNYQNYHNIFNQRPFIAVLTPTGQVHHTNIVTVITFTSTILGAFYILYQVLFRKKSMKLKKE